MLQPITEVRQAQIIAICRELVSLKTLSGNEKPAVDCAVSWMSRLGFDHVMVDDCGNGIGVLRGTESGPTILFDSHVDTVDVDLSAWRHQPFAGTLVGGRIYGRGTTDMKGALAACMAGLAFAREDGQLRGTIIVTASVGEEMIEGLALTRLVPSLKPDLVIICEASGLKLNVAQRGRAEVTISVRGRSAHASTPHLGINAVRYMARLITELDKITPPTDRQLGSGILEPTEIISMPFPSVSVVPWLCRARYDRRLLVGETEPDILGPIEDVIDRLKSELPMLSAQALIEDGEFVCYTGVRLIQKKIAPAWRMPAASRWMPAVQAALRSVGQEAPLGHYSFCTNGSLTAGRLGIPTFGYGPGFEESAHKDDEYIDLDQLIGAAAGYYALSNILR